MAESTVQKVIETIEGLTVTELAALVKELKEKFGVSGLLHMAEAGQQQFHLNSKSD